MISFTRSWFASLALAALIASPFSQIIPSLVYADTPDSGLIGNVINVYESYVEGASVKLSCTDSWNYSLGYTDVDGNYEFTIEDILGFFGDSECEDGSQLRIIVEKEHYYPVEPQVVATINFDAANAETLQEWAEWYFNTLRTHGFVPTPRPAGWYGEVLDDNTYEPIAGATLTVSCSTQDSSRVIATSSEDGTYEITQNQFVAQLNSIGCYYDDSFDVVVVASYDGYEDDYYTESDVSGSNMGASFDEPMEVLFYLYPEPINPATYYAEGDGTEENPFIIDTVERFNAMGLFYDYNYAEGLYFALNTDIVFDGDEGDIGNFAGNIDGREHSVSGTTRELFGRLEGNATVRNLSIVDAVIAISNSESDIGVLTGEMVENASVENVHVSGSIEVECGLWQCYRIGGLVGVMKDTTNVYRSSADVAIEATEDVAYYTGGLVGRIAPGGTVRESFATGNISAGDYVGGLVGILSSLASVYDSYATGDVRGNGSVGGLVGEIDGFVFRSYATGSVSATDNKAGGFVGTIADNDAYVASSFSTTQTVTGDSLVGGFAGAMYDGGVVRNSAWFRVIGKEAIGLVDISTTCGLGTAMFFLMDEPCDFGFDVGTLDEFKENGYGGDMAPFYLDGDDSWDFGGVWGFDEDINDGLPYLLWGTDWEPEEEEVTPPNNGGSSGGSSGSRGGGGARTTVATDTSTMLSSLVAQLRLLIAAYEAAGGTLTSAMRMFTAENLSSFTGADARDLQVGDQGEDVRALQALLISQSQAIPAGATGFFAAQTRDALAAWQTAHGVIPSQGYFGTLTRAAMKTANLPGLWW